MTRPIRNTGPCFPSGLPRQRGQRDVLSHTEFYTPIFCMLSVFQAIPFELPRKPPTVNRWNSTLCTPGWGQVLQSIWSPMCSVPQRPRQGGRVTPGFCYERDFMMLLSDDKQADVIDALTLRPDIRKLS